MFKVCPQGHGEFQSWVERCPDCGGSLRLATSAELPEPVRAEAELPPASELACLERGDPRALAEIAGWLQEAGLSCRIDVHPPGEPIRPSGRRGAGVANTFGLYVLPDELEDARAVLTERIHATLPEAAGHATAAGTELHACPACGEPLPESARECAGCGLEFPEAQGDG